MSTPPGASYRVSNASIIAKRRLLRLEDPVRLKFDSPWGEGDPLFDWYHRRPSRFIHTMQPRKEDESPFFHEYIVFSLGPNGDYFRVDRRQKPDESVPLDSIYKHGVEAHDTIEQITSLEDATYSSSQCLMSIEFKNRTRVPLALLLSVARAVQGHRDARTYTLQRYNCYFFAQTVMVCIARSVARGKCRTAKYYEAQLFQGLRRKIKKGRESGPGGVDSLSPFKLKAAPRKLVRHRIRIWGSPYIREDDIDIRVAVDYPRIESQVQSRGSVYTLFRGNPIPQQDYINIKSQSFDQMISYLERLIDEHSARVERYKVVLKCSAREVSRDIKTAMCDIEREISG